MSPARKRCAAEDAPIFALRAFRYRSREIVAGMAIVTFCVTTVSSGLAFLSTEMRLISDNSADYAA
jgi:hypothetical protein